MLGWDSAATARASRSKRARRSGSAAKRSGRTLIATSRFRRASRARYTSPMPPAPSEPVISYEPRRVPGLSDIRPPSPLMRDRSADHRPHDLDVLDLLGIDRVRIVGEHDVI